MTHHRMLLVLGIAAILAPVACSDEGVLPDENGGRGESETVGQIALNLLLPDGSTVSEVEWKLIQDGVTVRSGTAPVQDDGRATVSINGVPADDGYHVEMTAKRGGNRVSCAGESQEFEVVAGEAVSVSVTLQCDNEEEETGGIDIIGGLNICPTVPSIVASPTSAKVGGAPIALSAASTDADGDVLSYEWVASGGSLSSSSGAATSFSCTAPGSFEVSVVVEDEKECAKQTTTSVTCEARCDVQPTSDFRTLCDTANDQARLASELTASYATREIANHADQMVFWPHDSASPTHLVFCIESGREELADGRLQPSVQAMDLGNKQIHTVVRGMVGCDGIRTTPWGTVLATEEFADDNGGLYEILFDPASAETYSISERGDNGAPATVVDSAGNDASDAIIKRVATPSMAWEGLVVLPSGVLIGGDEERPGSIGPDADGGALFKFLPSSLRTGTAPITALSESPLVSGTVWALQATCVNNNQQFGQGCEIGLAAWVPVDAAMARPDSDAKGGTGFYRPEDLELDPHFPGPGIRFCSANTGNASSGNYGEVVCGVDTSPNTASATQRTVTINRFIEGDAELNQPDNLAFHPTIPGLLYVIEDNGNGDIWACLPDGADRDIKSDGCVRMLSLADRTAEPTGFIFTPDGTQAYVNVQHSRDRNMPFVDGYATDDVLLISGFSIPAAAAIASFGPATQASLEAGSFELFGMGTPLAASASVNVPRASTFGGTTPAPGNNGHGNDASQNVLLAGGLSATYLTRIVANSADQFEFWPPGSDDPDYLMFCIEGSRELIGPDKFNPSVQAVDIDSGAVRTIVRGMVGCDGLRVSPWGTLLATEEFADDNGGLYEIFWDPASNEEYTITERGDNGEPATIVDSSGNPAADVVVKRTALASMAWEGLLVHESGVIVAGDEERPGSVAADSDGGAIFKFVPSVLRTSSGHITSLAQSPLVAGTNHALQVSCVGNTQQFGQGCEIGSGAWVSVSAANARPDADAAGATGYYRPEDLQEDPDYVGPGVRFCVANTGNASAANFGEVLCAVDIEPTLASPSQRTVTINRLLEGDTQLNAPDNLEFQAGTGILYVIEDNAFGDIWACLPDGPDRDIKSDGCVRALSLTDRTAEPTGFKFHPDGTQAYFVVQHSADPANARVDGYNTDDLIVVSGFGAVASEAALGFGGTVEARLANQSNALFGFGTPLTASAGN